MKKNKKSLFRPLSTIATIVAMVLVTSLNAQAPGPPTPGDDGGTDNDTGSNDSIPLDGGLGILVLGAAAFGIKKLKDRGKK